MANADDEAVTYVLLDKDGFIKHILDEAKRLHNKAGRWDGTTAGRSSGLYKALAQLDEFTINPYGDDDGPNA
jgi:hypothetical protein